MKKIVLSKRIEGWGVEERDMCTHISTLRQCGHVFPEEARLKNKGPNKSE